LPKETASWRQAEQGKIYFQGKDCKADLRTKEGGRKQAKNKIKKADYRTNKGGKTNPRSRKLKRENSKAGLNYPN